MSHARVQSFVTFGHVNDFQVKQQSLSTKCDFLFPHVTFICYWATVLLPVGEVDVKHVTCQIDIAMKKSFFAAPGYLQIVDVDLFACINWSEEIRLS